MRESVQMPVVGVGCRCAQQKKSSKLCSRFALTLIIVLFCLFVSPSAGATVEEQLAAALSKYANSKKQIAITFTNAGYLHYALNWLSFLRDLDVSNYLIFALDEQAYAELQRQDANVFYDESMDKGKIEKQITDFGSDPFKKIVHLKPTLTLRVLQLGYKLLLSDADVVWFRNPFEAQEIVGSHFSMMSDAHFGASMGTADYFVNSGFAYMTPVPIVISFMEEVVRLLASRPDKMDQDAYNTAISNWERRTTDPLSFAIFDPAIVSNGWVYFVRHLGQRTDAPLIAVHNNWADGSEGGTNVQKIFRFREHLLWTMDPDTYYDPPGGAKYLTYSHGDVGVVDLLRDVAALRDALAIAQALGRTLILPDFECGGEWLPTDGPGGRLSPPARCTADTFLDVQVWVRSKEEMVATQLPGGAVGITTSEGAVNEADLRSLAQGPMAEAPILHFEGILGRFAGFDNSVTQLYFDKAVRRGVREGYYLREGANRINIKHAPSHCTMLSLPDDCPLQSSCVAKIVDELAAAFATEEWSRVQRQCVFVVTTVVDRRKSTLGAVLGQLRRLYQTVLYVGEDILEFPLSDLWRMGNHHMVTGMQVTVIPVILTCFCAYFIEKLQLSTRLSSYICVENSKAKSKGPGPHLYPFDKEAIYLRAEDTGMPSLVLTRRGITRVQPKLTCPAPDYGGSNKMLLDVGLEYQQEHRKFAMAAQCFEEALALEENDLQAWQWLANVNLNRNSLDGAVKAYAAANKIQPNAAQYINMGVALQRAGRSAEAVEAYREAIKLEYNWPEAHHNLANSLLDIGRGDEALEAFNRTLSLRPTFAMAYAGMAGLYSARGQVAEAEAMYRAAAHHEPLEPQYLLDLGQVLHGRGAYQEEQEVYQTLMNKHPGTALAYSYMATSILSEYQRAIGYRSYGKVPEDQIYLDRAIALYSKALEVDNTCGMCHGQLGDMYKDSHQVMKAIEHYRMSSILLPHVPTIFCNLVYTKLFACDWTDYESDFARLMEMVKAEVRPGSLPRYQCVQPLQGVLYRPLSADLLRAVTVTYVNKLLEDAGRPKPMPLPRGVWAAAADGRLRLGYLSADFKDHPVAKRMQDIYALHDRKRVRVTCYCLNANDQSPWRIKIEAAAERFMDLQPLLVSSGAGAVARRIAADEVDVLVNLAGHTRGNDDVTLVMAQRPAPVQLLHEGYAGTMGGASTTAHITDRISSPPEFVGHYVEKLLYMPHTFFVNDHRQTYPELLGDDVRTPAEKAQRLAFGSMPPDLPFVFGAFNQLYKIDPGVFDVWMAAMRAAPRSHLWLIRIHTRDPEANLKARAQSRGVDPSRVHFTQGYNERQHLYVKMAADVFLDTPTYNAHSSGCDALWAGMPLLTVPGEKMASRVAASLTAAIGCSLTIVQGEQEYAMAAAALARPSGRALARARDCVRAGKAAAPLFDTARWVRDQERALRMAADVAFAQSDPSRGGPADAAPFHIVTTPSHPTV